MPEAPLVAHDSSLTEPRDRPVVERRAEKDVDPRPDAGPPSACRLTIAGGATRWLYWRAYRHTVRALSLPRDRAVRTPRPTWPAAAARFPGEACAPQPLLVDASAGLAVLVPPRPVGTWRPIDASSACCVRVVMKTTMPAMLAGAAPADEMIGVACCDEYPDYHGEPDTRPTRRSTAQR